jgi:hypothetical protein
MLRRWWEWVVAFVDSCRRHRGGLFQRVAVVQGTGSGSSRLAAMLVSWCTANASVAAAAFASGAATVGWCVRGSKRVGLWGAGGGGAAVAEDAAHVQAAAGQGGLEGGLRGGGAHPGGQPAARSAQQRHGGHGERAARAAAAARAGGRAAERAGGEGRGARGQGGVRQGCRGPALRLPGDRHRCAQLPAAATAVALPLCPAGGRPPPFHAVHHKHPGCPPSLDRTAALSASGAPGWWLASRGMGCTPTALSCMLLALGGRAPPSPMPWNLPCRSAPHDCTSTAGTCTSAPPLCPLPRFLGCVWCAAWCKPPSAQPVHREFFPAWQLVWLSQRLASVTCQNVTAGLAHFSRKPGMQHEQRLGLSAL